MDNILRDIKVVYCTKSATLSISFYSSLWSYLWKLFQTRPHINTIHFIGQVYPLKKWASTGWMMNVFENSFGECMKGMDFKYLCWKSKSCLFFMGSVTLVTCDLRLEWKALINSCWHEKKNFKKQRFSFQEDFVPHFILPNKFEIFIHLPFVMDTIEAIRLVSAKY